MKSLFILLFPLLLPAGFEKKPDAGKILEEGKLLYRLERASWYGTDEFMAYFPNLRDSLGGYISYENEDHSINTIFFSRVNPYRIFVRYQFDSLPGTKPVNADIFNKTASPFEKNLISIRQDALMIIRTNADGFFRFYNSTSLNPIPIINDKERKVYFITASSATGQVLLGNDYLVWYDKNLKFESKERIHNSLIVLQVKSNNEEEGATIATMHSHVNSEIIDPTDICTLLLYKEFVDWKSHYVLSKSYVSILDMEKETLVIMTREEWEKISKVEDEN